MSFVEGDGVSGHEAAHYFAKWRRAYAQKKVKMVRNQGPGVALGLGFINITRWGTLVLLLLYSDFTAPFYRTKDVYTTHSPVGYLPRDVASLRIRHEQLIRLDFHQLDCSLVGRSDVGNFVNLFFQGYDSSSIPNLSGLPFEYPCEQKGAKVIFRVTFSRL